LEETTVELEQQLRVALAPCSSGTAVRVAVLARLSASQGRGRLHRLTPIGGMVALAAAAGMLAIYLGSGRALRSPAPAVAMPAATAANALAPADTTPVAVGTDAPVAVQSEEPLPRLLPPDHSAQETAIDLALQQAAERHPELVVGPDTDGLFSATLLIRADGTLVGSVVRLIPASKRGTAYRLAAEEMEVPFDASQSAGFRAKGALLPDGSALRAPVDLQLGVVSDSYDMARSEHQVLTAVRKQNADLVLPGTGAEQSLLTIFLSADGSIDRESLEHEAQLAPPPVALRPGEGDRTGQIARFLAQEVATRLSLHLDQIGVVGVASMEMARAGVQPDASGAQRRGADRDRLQILYAWPRQAGESAPVFGQFGPAGTAPATLEPKFNEAAALEILKREIPDAFLVDTDVAGTLGVFLNHQGELIRAERLPASRDGANNDFELVQQLAPGVKMGEGTRWNIKDETGTTAHVVFAWGEKPAPPAAN
jgi:hypothetical protein